MINARMLYLFFIIGSFYPKGEPISQHLLRCRAFAVKDHSVMSSRGAERRGDLTTI